MPALSKNRQQNGMAEITTFKSTIKSNVYWQSTLMSSTILADRNNIYLPIQNIYCGSLPPDMKLDSLLSSTTQVPFMTCLAKTLLRSVTRQVTNSEN